MTDMTSEGRGERRAAGLAALLHVHGAVAQGA